MKSKTTSRQKKPYSSPRLTTYGSLRTLTMAKKGLSGDGAGKPRTRLSGGAA